MMVMMLNLLWTELLHFGIELLLEKTNVCVLLKLHILNMYILCLNWGFVVVGLFDLFYISLTNKNAHYNKTFLLHSGKTVQL